MLNKTRIITRLLIGFSVVLLGAAALGLLGAQGSLRQAKMASLIFDHPFSNTVSIMEMRDEVMRVESRMTHFVHAETIPESVNVRLSLQESLRQAVAAMQHLIDGSTEKARVASAIDAVNLEQTIPITDMQRYTRGCQKNGGKASFADYRTSRYDDDIPSPTIEKDIAFAPHNLAAIPESLCHA